MCLSSVVQAAFLALVESQQLRKSNPSYSANLMNWAISQVLQAPDARLLPRRLYLAWKPGERLQERVPFACSCASCKRSPSACAAQVPPSMHGDHIYVALPCAVCTMCARSFNPFFLAWPSRYAVLNAG